MLAIPTRKAQGLLAYLALTPGQVHPRDKLAALLWPDTPPGSARADLRQTLFVLRKALGGAVGDPLAITADAITLPADAVPTDVAAFERAAAAGTPPALEAAAGLYRGDFLAGVSVEAPPFEDWLMSERERLRELALEVLARLLAQYQECVDVLRRELGVEPEGETEELYREVLRQRPAQVATTTASVATPAEAPLVGRDTEMARLGEATVSSLVWAARSRGARQPSASARTRTPVPAAAARAVGGLLAGYFLRSVAVYIRSISSAGAW
jgi:DNA-binding SARP family transcriptional activator